MRESSAPFGIVGGPDAADLQARLAQAAFVHHPVPAPEADGHALAVYDSARALLERGARAILLPCFASHVFRDALQAELPVPVLDMMAALRACLAGRVPVPRRIGILGGGVEVKALLERGLGAGHALLHAPASRSAADACRDLIARGADLIVPAGAGHAALWRQGLPVLDINGMYARYAAVHAAPVSARPVVIGIVGGVGPAATVDFMDKIVRNTPAGSDQEHLKLVVEQNPQIPDRSAHLAGRGADPTLALYAACRKLQDGGAGLIAIPCNTAHAYIARIQARLQVPILDMPQATADAARTQLVPGTSVGLLATDGTIQSRLYHAALERAGLRALAPDGAHQRMVMDAIYGPDGIKAGRVGARCRDTLLAVLRHLAARGAGAAILGCTELPIVLGAGSLALNEGAILLLDPTDILARACIRRVTQAAGGSAARTRIP